MQMETFKLFFSGTGVKPVGGPVATCTGHNAAAAIAEVPRVKSAPLDRVVIEPEPDEPRRPAHKVGTRPFQYSGPPPR